MGISVKKSVFIIGTVLVVGLGTIFGTMLIKTIKYTIENHAEKELEESQDLSFEEINQIVHNKPNSNKETGKAAGKELGKEAGKELGKETGKEAGKETSKEIGKEAGKKTEKEIGKKTDKEAGKETGKKIGNETENKIDSETKSNKEERNIENGYYANADGLNTSGWEAPSVEVGSNSKMALNIKNPTITVHAESAILIDCKNGKVLYHKNPTTQVYPASTTKLMTALAITELCDLNESVIVGDEIKLIASDSSRAYLREGERLTVQMLLEGMLIPSGNDAAYALAAYGGKKILNDEGADTKKAVNAFVNKMNEKVKELGLKGTHFKNPDGYDAEGQYTTAYDMGIISLEAIKNNTIKDITGKDRTRNIFLSGEDITWKSTNKLVVNGSGAFYKYAIGLKTGTSSLAGRCLVSAAEKEDKECISVVMNSTAAGRWEDSIALLKYGIEH